LLAIGDAVMAGGDTIIQNVIRDRIVAKMVVQDDPPTQPKPPSPWLPPSGNMSYFVKLIAIKVHTSPTYIKNFAMSR